ncbi:Lrp/AsnC ligand binding domain-containing protein [Mycobacterium sp. DL592]|uniref:Lrp/AsnC ligand binding domain-containing protein n=1 Tax=Mycobacterium sp. DL592 TaxID=2675524 RepID=UPI001FB8EAA6|nr:Lrp/AsnC ligand binding domain-containing protein [Mycobacterium sp. DL592]
MVTPERLLGEPDFTLRVLAHDLLAYQNIYDNGLGALPGVQRLTSTLVMKRIGSDRSVPIRWSGARHSAQPSSAGAAMRGASTTISAWLGGVPSN